MRVLIVDDEPLIAQTLTTIFQRQGFQVDTAYGAVQAMDQAKLSRPDLVLCDLDMPQRDGVALMQDLQVEMPEVPILMLTGYIAGLDRVEKTADRSHQTVRILVKPCQPVEVLREARVLLKTA